MSDLGKIITCLKYMNISVNLNTFSQRKQLQKLTYLIQAVGIDLGYKFNWYLHGPYSPDLTNVLFESQKTSTKEPTLTHIEKNKLEQLKEFLGNDIESSENLEIMVSLHFLLTIGKRNDKTDEEMLELLKEKKPHLREEKIKKYYNKIKDLMNKINSSCKDC